MMILLHIRMAREESPLGKFFLLWVNHTLNSENGHHNNLDGIDHRVDLDDADLSDFLKVENPHWRWVCAQN